MAVMNGQFGNRCSDLILNLNECFEANGLWRGKKVCKAIQQDIDECNDWGIRERALMEIDRVRYVKLLKGEFKRNEAFLPKAPPNSFCLFPNHR